MAVGLGVAAEVWILNTEIRRATEGHGRFGAEAAFGGGCGAIPAPGDVRSEKGAMAVLGAATHEIACSATAQRAVTLIKTEVSSICFNVCGACEVVVSR